MFARLFLEVQRQSLALAEESLRNNRTRVEVGTIAPIDIVETENEVARNVAAVIRAEADVERVEDRLRTVILDTTDTPRYWSISFQPSDSPVLQAREIDVDAAVRNALLNRTDLDTLDNGLEVTDTNIRYHRKVFQAQRDLATARNQEQSAILDYVRSLVDFDAVQEIPLGGVIP